MVYKDNELCVIEYPKQFDCLILMKSYKDVGCRNCGAVFPMELSNTPVESKGVWFPGKKCPMCGSQEFYPTIKPSEPANVKSKKEWRYNPYYGLIALGIVIIIIPVWLIASRRSGSVVSKNIVLVCSECKEIFEKKVVGAPPYECPKCFKEAAYQALYCPNDLFIYSRKAENGTQTSFPSCPECGAKKAGIIFKMSTVQEIKRKRKEYEEWKKMMKEKEKKDAVK